jgi:Uma2 family endonuclease
MATAEPLLTAEEYGLLSDIGQPTELVRGRIVYLDFPAPRHGCFCGNITRLLGNFVAEHDLGRVMTNDSGIITEHGPDTVRGPHVSFYSYDRLPKGPLPEGYLDVAPEVVFEVRSPTDRWNKIFAKVAEFLSAGVDVVSVLDPQTETLTVYQADELPRVLTAAEELVLPKPLDGFRVTVQRFFD